LVAIIWQLDDLVAHISSVCTDGPGYVWFLDHIVSQLYLHSAVAHGSVIRTDRRDSCRIREVDVSQLVGRNPVVISDRQVEAAIQQADVSAYFSGVCFLPSQRWEHRLGE